MIVRVDLISPFGAGKIGPMILIEPRRVLQPFLRNIQHEQNVVAGVVRGFEFFERNGEQFLANS